MPRYSKNTTLTLRIRIDREFLRQIEPLADLPAEYWDEAAAEDARQLVLSVLNAPGGSAR